MLLHNVLAHAAGTAVLVNGTIYHIDVDGNAEVQKEEDAKKLLSGSAWKLVGAAVKVEKPVVATKAAKAKIELLDNSGQPVSKPSAVKLEKQPEAAKGKVKDKAAKVVESEDDPPIPPKGETWADPLPSYSMEWLTKCAKAYKVMIPKGVSKKNICTLLVEAMYE